MNTDGDTTIKTGNANVSANALTFANNNLAGNVVYGVVNIYGTLEGDIVLPDGQVANTGNSLSNAGNGSGSTNTASSSKDVNSTTFQSNDATIANNLTFNARLVITKRAETQAVITQLQLVALVSTQTF